MSIFKTIADQLTTLSPLMEGREKMTIEDIRTSYPDGVTIDMIDLITTTDEKGNESTYPVLVCKEEPQAFFFGGLVAYKIVCGWIEHFGSVEDTNAALDECGGVLCKFTTRRTKNKRNVTIMTVVE